jgi:hypothetical protein
MVLKQTWVLTCLVGGIALIVNACATNTTASNQNKPTSSSQPSPSISATLPTPKVNLGQFVLIPGTDYLHAPVVVSGDRKSANPFDYESEYSSKGSMEEIRNYVFVNRNNLATVKLLPDNNARLMTMEEIGQAIPKKGKIDRSLEPIALPQSKSLWLLAIPKDTNNDQKLTTADRQEIALADVSGENYTVLIKDIDRISLIHQRTLDRRLVFYRSNNRHFVADVNIATRQATVKELPAIQ